MLSLSNYCALASRLGWGAMQVDIAVPAIDKIVSHFMWLENERHGATITPEEAVAILLENWKADQIFGLLGCTDDPNYLGSKDESDFIAIRKEIEECMFMGFSFVDSTKEWD
jgi:hypothetical protein